MPKQKGAGSKVKTSRRPSQDENVLILNYTNSVKQRVCVLLNRKRGIDCFILLFLLNCGKRAASVSVDIEPTSSDISAVSFKILVLI